jgi:hypothetical protein
VFATAIAVTAASQGYAALTSALCQFGQEQLGCRAISPPWLSVYIDGCEQRFHTDAWHGPWAFVLSLTDWDTKEFTGGETQVTVAISPRNVITFVQQLWHIYFNDSATGVAVLLSVVLAFTTGSASSDSVRGVNEKLSTSVFCSWHNEDAHQQLYVHYCIVCIAVCAVRDWHHTADNMVVP